MKPIKDLDKHKQNLKDNNTRNNRWKVPNPERVQAAIICLTIILFFIGAYFYG